MILYHPSDELSSLECSNFIT